MGRTVSTEELQAGKLLYNDPKTGEDVKETVKVGPNGGRMMSSDELSGGKLLYNDPSDGKIRVPQQEVKQVTKDPALKGDKSTLSGYLNYRLDSFIENVSKDYQESVRQSSEAFERMGKGEQTKLETALQVTGDTANLIGDAIGETVVQIGGSTLDGISVLTPDFIEEPVKQAAKESFEWVMDTPAAQAGLEAVYEGFDKWNEFEEANPRAAENIKSVAEIATVFAPTKGGKVSTTRENVGKVLEEAGKAKRIAGIKADVAKPGGKALGADIRYLDSFSDTKKKGYLDRTRSDNKIIYSNEQLAINETQALRGYNPKANNPHQLNQNFHLLDKSLIEAKAARDLLLEKSTSVIKPSEVYGRTATSVDDLLRNSPDPEALGKAVNGAYAEMERLLDMHGTTPKGLDLVRQDLNTWMNKHAPAGADPSHPVKASVGALRSEIKNVIDGSVPGYKKAQDKVTGLTHAKKNLGDKLALDAGNKLLGYLDSALASVGLSRDMAFMLSAVGVGSYASMALPILLAGGAGVTAFRTGKLIHSGVQPGAMKKLVGTVEELTGQMIRNAKGDPSLIKKIRADRAAVLEVIKEGAARSQQPIAPEPEVEEGYNNLEKWADQAGMSVEEYKAQLDLVRKQTAKEGAPLQVEVNQGSNLDELDAIIQRNKK